MSTDKVFEGEGGRSISLGSWNGIDGKMAGLRITTAHGNNAPLISMSAGQAFELGIALIRCSRGPEQEVSP